jgi:Co/Zn/Cd efflux system component
VLLDICPSPGLAQEIQAALMADGTAIADFHLWRVGPGHYGLVASLVPAVPVTLADYKARLIKFEVLSHTTIEICE